MEKITSTKNTKVKQWKKLHSSKGRKEFGQYILEGEHLFQEAKKAEILLQEVIVTQSFLDKQSSLDLTGLSSSVFIVTDEIMKVISQTQTSQGILCILNMTESHLSENISGKLVLLDGVQDPGNAGTIVRTADAAGYSGVVFGTGSVDPYNDKVIRSMQGSHFHIPIYRGDLNEVIHPYIKQNIPVYGTALDERAQDFRSVAKTSSLAIIFGNEGNGISEKILEKTTENLYIPILGEAESLNVAVAAGILIYHFL
ncbi:RNA methyltransferase [Jeotgalibaca sp. MA1X17-3]|uniref:TrmH family RNA methyltransferase n=1 Tax=Jeotgalibaca sp. MA1X17-3 TaxID=2908211 RepID=UPI001F4880CD|nr:RNA methyltransferase [Jeotgalibaca sp. MA1X17-3]UJF14638.1 RNA methyltransferase [Jeotgalibaca sp. MA1X17-3]